LLTICSGVCNLRFIWVSLSKKPTNLIGYPLIRNGTVFGGHANAIGKLGGAYYWHLEPKMH